MSSNVVVVGDPIWAAPPLLLLVLRYTRYDDAPDAELQVTRTWSLEVPSLALTPVGVAGGPGGG